ncbi:OmpA family protein [Hyalangium sp.]|uniref:OmpA family protein n=1 Tax=Hyalangium sp. TaxID=2028555 RepID=UPI002D319B0C|nr:OmpA family protein [Hyalangium sp.]HYH95104.1 OmpA family protein [Hyalangium sp.]
MNARLLLLSLALASSPALAGDAIHVSLDARMPLGQGTPALKVEILEPILGFDVKLKRSDGKVFEFKEGGRPGTTRTLPLEQPEGRFHYEGELTVRFKGAEPGTMPLSFDTELLGPLTLTVSKEDLDLAGRKLRFKLSRPAARAKLTVLVDSGWNAFDGEVKFKGEPGGTPLEVTWPKVPGKVMKISLQAYDTADFYQSVDFFPWQVDIPHEEVNFPSGSAEIPAAERGKLDRSVEKLTEAVKRYGELAAVRLYILGHTDTVGATPSNRELSLQRARSIASYFRRKGARLPTFYEGFGEQAPHVVTPDETDEAGNRRAEYIISVDDPVLTNAPFAPQWRKL